jgi:hypothetical protein
MILVEPQTPKGVKALEKSTISQKLRPIILFIQTLFKNTYISS